VLFQPMSIYFFTNVPFSFSDKVRLEVQGWGVQA